MPEIKVDITGETGKIIDAIDDVKDAVKDTAGSVSNSAAAAGKAVDNTAKKTAQNTKNAAKETRTIGEQAKDASGKISSAGGALSAMGASIGQQFGAAGQMISALASGPVGAVTAAIGAAIALGVKLWDEFTVSAEEAAMKTAAAVEKANLARQEAEQAFSDNSSYMERLKELSKQENLSNEAKNEAATLIGIVQKRYGDLGLSIDKAKGKLMGFDQAQEEFFQKSRQDRLKAAGNQIRALDQDVDAQFRVMGSGFSTTERKKAAVKNMRQMFKTASIDQKIAFAERSYDNAKTKEDVDQWKKILDILRERKKITEEYISLKNRGEKNDKETAAAAKKKTDEAQKEKEQKQKKADAEELPFAAMEKSAKREAEYSAMRLAKRERELAILQKIHALEDQKGRPLTDAEKDRVQKAAGAEFDVKQKEKKELESVKAAEAAKKADAERTREFQQQLKLKQLEIQGLTKEAALQREIYNLEKQKGRALTDAERAELSSRLAATQALDAAGKEQSSMLGYYAQFRNDSPYKSDRLVQMGAKVKAVSATDWQAKNHDVLKTISKSVETIVQRANAPAGSNTGGTFI